MQQNSYSIASNFLFSFLPSHLTSQTITYYCRLPSLLIESVVVLIILMPVTMSTVLSSWLGHCQSYDECRLSVK